MGLKKSVKFFDFNIEFTIFYYMYVDLIEYATVTFQLALEHERYKNVLICYEYLAVAYDDLGRNQD